MAGGLSSEAVCSKLLGVSPTPQSIQTVSLWMIHHKRHSKQIVDLWLSQVLKEKRPQRLLTLLYLANDVVQNSRKKCPLYMDEFRGVMTRSLEHIRVHADPSTLNSVKRVVNVWNERGVYDPGTIEKFKAALSYVEPPPASREVKSPAKKKIAFAEQEVTAASILAEPKKEPEPPETAQLVEVLRKLEHPASADAITREKIAAFPESVANPALLKKICESDQAEELLSIVKSAEPTVTNYCKRLNEEMEERKRVQIMLAGYIRVQKEKAERSQELLSEFRERRELLKRQRVEIHKHYESLPDLEKLPNPTQLAPLPSAGDLFTK